MGVDVKIDGVHKVFESQSGQVNALQDINLEIQPGEFISLVGRSGCGKTTLLRTIAGLTDATHGSVSVGGRQVKSPRLDVGMMFQEATLLPWRTASQNVVMPIEVTRRVQPSDRDRAKQLLTRLGLEGFEDHYPKQLSGGMQQRVALARLLVGDPALLLLDEPFGALDEFTREDLNLELRRVTREAKATSVLVTHNISEAVFLSDRIVTLASRPGRVTEVITTGFDDSRGFDLLETPEFQKVCRDVRKALEI